jgi:hypothetical protein
MKLFKLKIERSVIDCKFFKTSNLKLVNQNFQRITEILNLTLQRKEIFDNSNIYMIMQNIQQFFEFLDEFYNNIKSVEDIDSLKDRQIVYFQKQAEIEKFLKDNFDNPKPIILQDGKS